jgi:hypothetical protein
MLVIGIINLSSDISKIYYSCKEFLAFKKVIWQVIQIESFEKIRCYEII